MRLEKYGISGKKVFILHGWTHSSDRYKKLAGELSKDMKITLATLPGFGDTKCKYKRSIVRGYLKELNEHLSRNHYDLIVAHSMGGNLILRTLSKNENIRSKVLLLNPAYFGIDHVRFISKLFPLSYMLFFVQRNLPLFIASPLIKAVSLFNLRNPAFVDDITVSDTRGSDPYVTAYLMKALAHDTWRLPKNLRNDVTIIAGRKDKRVLFEKIEVLCEDLPNAKLIVNENGGHTSVVEYYDDVLNTIKNILKD